MSVDYKSLKKVEALPASSATGEPDDDDRLVVLVKLSAGAAEPSYMSPRARMGDRIFSAEVRARDLVRMEADPAVESVSVSRRLPLLK